MAEVKEREPWTFPFTPEERNEHHVEHEWLCRLVTKLPSDFEPWGERSRDSASMTDPMPQDCSCGCVFYKILAEPLGGDWGVCANPKSPRCGLLTFEHQGCPEFVSDCADEDCTEDLTLAEHLRREGETQVFRCPRCKQTRESLKGVEDERCHSHRRFVQMKPVAG